MFGSYATVLAVILVSDYIERWRGGGGGGGGGRRRAVSNVKITKVLLRGGVGEGR